MSTAATASLDLCHRGDHRVLSRTTGAHIASRDSAKRPRTIAIDIRCIMVVYVEAVPCCLPSLACIARPRAYICSSVSSSIEQKLDLNMLCGQALSYCAEGHTYVRWLRHRTLGTPDH